MFKTVRARTCKHLNIHRTNWLFPDPKKKNANATIFRLITTEWEGGIQELGKPKSVRRDLDGCWVISIECSDLRALPWWLGKRRLRLSRSAVVERESGGSSVAAWERKWCSLSVRRDGKILARTQRNSRLPGCGWWGLSMVEIRYCFGNVESIVNP